MASSRSASLKVSYRGATLREFDLDGALARHPRLLLVDELAHTNAPGSRHAKRWQDVLELLDVGIDVSTTVNVQHLESLNDVVARITGVVVRETVPDSVLQQADEVELIDLPPDDLGQRFKEGKVYLPDQAQDAMRNFFRKGNLIALRELALRATAERVDAQMRAYMREHTIGKIWPAVERLLVCVGPSPSSARLVRAAKRRADRLGAEWIVAYVETPAQLRLSAEARDRVIQTLRLAEQLGAKTVTLSGQKMSQEILAFAHERNVTNIIVGKPTRPLWKRILIGSIVDALVEGSEDIDIDVISGEAGEGPPALPGRRRRLQTDWTGYGRALAVVAVATGVAWLMFPFFQLSNLIMVYRGRHRERRADRGGHASTGRRHRRPRPSGHGRNRSDPAASRVDQRPRERSRPAPTTTSASPLARGNSWPASESGCAAPPRRLSAKMDDSSSATSRWTSPGDRSSSLARKCTSRRSSTSC
jgi:two-component system sensor histidine kinase KdpD